MWKIVPKLKSSNLQGFLPTPNSVEIRALQKSDPRPEGGFVVSPEGSRMHRLSLSDSLFFFTRKSEILGWRLPHWNFRQRDSASFRENFPQRDSASFRNTFLHDPIECYFIRKPTRVENVWSCVMIIMTWNDTEDSRFKLQRDKGIVCLGQFFYSVTMVAFH